MIIERHNDGVSLFSLDVVNTGIGVTISTMGRFYLFLPFNIIEKIIEMKEEIKEQEKE
ncbi:MAG: hypothetical protein QW051_05120 [Candidatus Aenigmatarchaeota archaeon]